MARPYSYIVQCAFSTSPDAALSTQAWTDITAYVDTQVGISISNHGRGDEDDDIQPTELSLVLDNRDGRFTPENTTSPYYPNVKTGKRIRVGLSWAGNGKQFYPDDPGFESTTTSFGWGGDGTAPPTRGPSTARVWQGTQSLRITWAAGAGRAYKNVYGLRPGRQYTASAYLNVPAGAPDVAFGVGGGVGSTMSVKDTWTRVSYTFTAPSYATYLTIDATGTAGTFCYVDGAQLEVGPVATTWESTPGTFEWRFTGDVNEWPLNWVGGPAAYAESRVTATDRLKKLGDLGELRSFLKEDVLDDSPIAYYPLDEPVGSTTAGDISGNSQGPLGIAQVGGGGQTIFGWDHTDGAAVADYAVPDWYRDSTTGIKFVPSALGSPITAAYPQGQYLRGTLNTSVTSPTGASIACWAFFPSSGKSDFGPIAFLTAADGSYLGIHLSVFGGITAIYLNQADGAGGVPWEVTVGTTYGYDTMNQWAAVLSVPTAGQGLVTLYRNGVSIGTSGPFTMTQQPAWNQVTVGGRDKTVDGVGRVNVSHVQVYDYPLGGNALAVQWYVGAQGRGTAASVDTSTFRIQKLLQFRALYGGNPFVSLNVNGTNPVYIGPQEVAGNPLDAIRAVGATEDGVFFIGGDGYGVWQLRNYRFNAPSAVTLDADQLDPGSLTYRGDDFGLVNDVTAGRPDGATVRYVNQASIADSGSRKASLTAIPQTDTDLSILAAWRVNTYGVQRNRITGVRVSLLNNPAQIRALLTLEIGSKITVTNLPSQAPTSSKELFVEGWDEVIGENEWSILFNTSPAEPWDVWQIGVAGRSEIGTTTRIAY